MRELWRRQPPQTAPRHLGLALRPPSHPPHPWPQADPVHRVSEWVLLSIYTSTWKTDSGRGGGAGGALEGVMGKTARARPGGSQ